MSRRSTVIEARCAEVGAELVLEFRDWEVEERLQALGGQALAVRGRFGTYDDLFLPLFGEHAARNAGAALVAFEAFVGEALDVDRTREAFAAVRWPGRMEVVARKPIVMLDGAHNPAGAEALSAALREAFTWSQLHFVITISGGKDIDGIVAQLVPLTDHAYVARNESDRSGDVLPIVERFAARDMAVTTFDDVASALDAARRRRRRGRSHPGDRLSVHCRGRPPGARFAFLGRPSRPWPSNPPSDRQARRRGPRPRRRGPSTCRGQGTHDRTDEVVHDRAGDRRGALRRAP